MSELCNKIMYLLTSNRAYIYSKINVKKPLLKLLGIKEQDFDFNKVCFLYE